MNKLIQLLLKNGFTLIADSVLDTYKNFTQEELYEAFKDEYGINITDSTTVLSNENIEILTDIELKLEFEGQEEFQETNEYSLDREEYDDVENAREMFSSIDSISTDKFLTRFVPYFSVSIIVIGFIYLFSVSFIRFDNLNGLIVQSISEFIKNIIIMVASFWVGSSVGSKLKSYPSNHDFDFDMPYFNNDYDDMDNSNVRKRYLGYVKQDKVFLTKFVPYFSIIMITLGFTYLFVASVIILTEINTQLIQSSVEFIKTLILMVISFWVGSSVGSKDKEQENVLFSDLTNDVSDIDLDNLKDFE